MTTIDKVSWFTGVIVALAMASTHCGGAVENATDAQRGVEDDRDAADSQDAATPPSWCSSLTAMQTDWVTQDHLDPVVACEERNGKRPATAYLCETVGSAPTDCVGFVSDNVPNGVAGVIVYCCD
jgi:hypothetical protein